MHGGWIRTGPDMNSHSARLYPQTIEWNVVTKLYEPAAAGKAGGILT